MRVANASGDVLVDPNRVTEAGRSSLQSLGRLAPAKPAERDQSQGRTMILTTGRLTLRPVAAGDACPLHELWSSAGVRRFLWDDEIIPMDRTRSAIELSHQLFEGRGHGLWSAWLKDSPELCGFGGLWPFRDPPQYELLYGVAERLWSRGYATEIGEAIVRYCTRSLGMPKVRASTDTGNVGSIRVLEKLGLRLVERCTVDGLDTVFYQWQVPAGDSRGGGATDLMGET